MKTNHALIFAAAILFASCGGNVKKVIVYANHDADINQDTKAITQKDDEGHIDKELDYTSGGKVELKVQQKDGTSTTLEIPDAGYYIINAKAKDTIIGGYQKYSTPEEANRMITQDELKHDIDSLQQMIEGKNTSAANKTFFIPPNTVAKITSNPDATIVGPYHRMTSIEKQGDKEPEVYRFYSISEVRETLAKLQKLTGENPNKIPQKENKVFLRYGIIAASTSRSAS
jgi:hypothetical protein